MRDSIAQNGRKPNMKDVARMAGVSLATVSRALRKPDVVAPETAARVADAVERTGYVYNATAADFTRQRSNLVGLIVFSMRSSIQSELIDGVQNELQAHGYSLIVGNSQYDPGTEAKMIRLFEERKLAGVIVAESTDANRAQLKRLAHGGIPIVLTWELTAEPAFDCVGIDNQEGARIATSHLIDLGHRRIGFIAGRYDRIERVRHRYDGYLAALEDAGIAPDEALCRRGAPNMETGDAAMRSLLAMDNPPTAVFAASDALALGTLAAATDLGLRVPQDVSIVGFDDLDFARFTCPPLTTIRVPVSEMGRLAASIVVKKALHTYPLDAPAERILLPTELVVRGSTAPIRAEEAVSGCCG